MTEPLRYPNPAIRWDLDAINELLVWTTGLGASDVTLSTGHPAWAEVHGALHPVTRPLSQSEMEEVLNGLYRADNAAAHVIGGNDLDFSHTIRIDRTKRMRFRCNAVGTMVDSANGISITLRTLPSKPPDPSQIDLEPEILQAMAADQGIIMVTGGTGSGKSTTLAAMNAVSLEGRFGPRKHVSFEAPIEFTYDEVPQQVCFIEQTEIGWGRNLPTFAAGVRNALRRKPMVMMVGESRDFETMAASVEAANTGHLLLTTIHTNSVPETMHRAVNMFPANERDGQSAALADALRLVMTQKLVRTVDGRRAAVREFLTFDEQMRTQIKESGVMRWSDVTRKLLHEHGQPMVVAARRLYDEGRIDFDTYKRFDRQAVAELREEI